MNSLVKPAVGMQWHTLLFIVYSNTSYKICGTITKIL